jgi:hypothetical protein
VQDASRSSKEDERGTVLATRARLGDYDEGVYSSQTTLPTSLTNNINRPDPGTTSPQPRLPHRRRTKKTPQCLHHHRRSRRRGFACRSRSRQIRSWKTSHHRFRPGHSVVVEQTRCGYSRRRRNAKSTLPPQTSGANHTMDAI